MKTYTPKTFTLGQLSGISEKNIEEHLKLYAGYVTSANLIQQKLHELAQETTPPTYIIGELRRRFAFEYNGMRNHELYFEQLEGGHHAPNMESVFIKKVLENYSSWEDFIHTLEETALTRGVGWTFVSYDRQQKELLVHWVEEQHLGHLLTTTPILALDMWEHAYVYDYPTSEKKKYIKAFLENVNWEIVVKRFDECEK